MARGATSRKNLFGFGGKTVTTYKHAGSTRRDLSSLAYKAGQRSGDTGLFSTWADSKHLKDNWDREAVRQFEQSYRKGVEKGEAVERRKEEKQEAKQEKREAKVKAKEELKEVQSDVIEALAGLGMSRTQAKTLARSKYREGDSFGELFDRIMKRSPSIGNPQSPVQLSRLGWRLVDKYRLRETAAGIAQKYAPFRLIYRSGQWEVWTRQAMKANPSIFDFETALRAGREDRQEFERNVGPIHVKSLAPNEIRNRFDIWWKYNHTSVPESEVHNKGANRAAFVRAFKAKNPAKFDRCVSDVSKSLKKEGRPGNAYAICTAAGTRNPVPELRKLLGRLNSEQQTELIRRIDRFYYAAIEEGFSPSEAQKFAEKRAIPEARKLVKNPSDTPLSEIIRRGLEALQKKEPYVYFEFGGREALIRTNSMTPEQWRALSIEKVRRIAVNPKRRRNPLEAAQKAYTHFTGLPATEVIEVKEPSHRHSTVFKNGQLVCLDVILPTGKEIPLIAAGFQFEPKRFLRRDLRHSQEADAAEATWVFDPAAKDKTVLVTFSEDGRQMMFTGGDQSMPLEALGFGDRDMRDNMFIGTIVEITYRGKKKFEADGKQETDFHHPFGSQGSAGILPLLGYFLRSKQMFSLGGRYKIAPVRADIGASPGIVG